MSQTQSILTTPEQRGPFGAKPTHDVFAYQPRRLLADPLLEVRGFVIKPYRLALDEVPAMRAVIAHELGPLLDLALPDKLDSSFHGPGFAVLHQGRDGVYLLAATWYAGHSLTSSTHLVVAGGPPRLEKLPHDLFACVWELGVYEFERGAWLRSTMLGRGLAGIPDYLAMRCEGLI